MKKNLILIFAVLAFGLAACGQLAEEATPSAVPTSSPQPTAIVTAAVTPAASATVTPAVISTPEPAPTAVVTSPVPMPTLTRKPIPEPKPTAAPTPEPAVEPTAEPEPSPTPELPSRPTDEEVLAAYRAACEAYNWFAVKTLDAHQDEKVELDGALYAKVADERFPNMDSLRGYLKTLFSDEVVDNLLPLDGQQYVEINGQLYVREGARGTDVTKGALTLSVEWPLESEPVSCIVRAEVELLDAETLSAVVGREVHEFPYQRVGDKWVFTWFAPIY